jgi:hypothetical protein
MTRIIERTELRINVDGEPVLDVIYTNGIKRKLDQDKLKKQLKRLRTQRKAIKAEIEQVDELLAMIDTEVTKKKS